MISIAPMIDISNHHFRALVRLMSKKAVLYTEMKSADAVIHNHKRFLPFHHSQHPIILQIGGCHPQKLAQAARIGQQYGYDGINLNVGCPSGKVQIGQFGAVLMKTPSTVKTCLKAIAKNISIPCSVKCRLGVDDFDSYQFLHEFVKIVSDLDGSSPTHKFVVHARKALLDGLKPAQNLTVPPLDYSKVFRLKEDFPSLSIHLNGGIKDIRQGYKIVMENRLQGFMVGRLALENPYELTKIDHVDEPILQQKSQELIMTQKLEIMMQYIEYIQKLKEGLVRDQSGNAVQQATMFTLVKPFINFYNGAKFSREFRRQLSDLTKFKQKDFISTIRSLALRITEQNLANESTLCQGINFDTRLL